MKHEPALAAALCALLVAAACGDDVTVSGSDGGSGGSTATGAGGTGGTGGFSSSSSNGSGGDCPALPSCNWCGGDTLHDADGCWIGYVCANGADPCSTDPCGSGSACPANQVCVDQLCWGCQEQGCGGGSAGTWCVCSYACDDGSTYDFDCQGDSCSCQVDGVEESTCSPDPQTCLDTAISCCGWDGG